MHIEYSVEVLLHTFVPCGNVQELFGVVGRYIRWFLLQRLRKLSEKIFETKICNPELHDIPHCPAQLPPKCACKYKGHIEGKIEQDNPEHE